MLLTLRRKGKQDASHFFLNNATWTKPLLIFELPVNWRRIWRRMDQLRQLHQQEPGKKKRQRNLKQQQRQQWQRKDWRSHILKLCEMRVIYWKWKMVSDWNTPKSKSNGWWDQCKMVSKTLGSKGFRDSASNSFRKRQNTSLVQNFCCRKSPLNFIGRQLEANSQHLRRIGWNFPAQATSLPRANSLDKSNTFWCKSSSDFISF